MLDQLKLIEAVGGAPLIMLALGAMLLLWRWLAHQDHRINDERARRFESSRAEMQSLGASVAAVGKQVDGCATQAELRRVEAEVARVQSDVRHDLAQIRGAVEVLATRVGGQAAILDRIDEHLRRRDA